MKNFIARMLGVTPRVKMFVRSALIKAGEISRLTADWNPTTTTADSFVHSKLVMMRARARQQEIDNDYAAQFYRVLEDNVLGSEGVALTVQARDEGGALDERANSLLWEGFKDWGRGEHCTVNGEDTIIDAQRLILRAAARDGGVLIRKRVGSSFGKYAFQLQLLEIDHLDHNYTGTADNGNRVVMGVEQNNFGRAIAYHLLDRHPGDIVGAGGVRYTRTQVPANEIIHYRERNRPTQTVGIPRLTSATTRLHHLGEYEHSEVIAARAGAAKGGWFESDKGTQFAGETELDADGKAATLNDFEPGSFDELPSGTKFVPYTPTHPTDAFSGFVRATLMGAAAGAGVSYATLTGDLSEANYSSMRAGTLVEREAFKRLQKHLIEHVLEPIFAAWLEAQLLSRRFSYGMDEFDRLNKPMFRGRRWPWVDPTKDIQASITAIENGLSSRTRVSDELGLDIEDTIEEIAAENAMAKKAGVTFGAAKATAQPTPIAKEEEEAVGEMAKK